MGTLLTLKDLLAQSSSLMLHRLKVSRWAQPLVGPWKLWIFLEDWEQQPQRRVYDYLQRWSSAVEIMEKSSQSGLGTRRVATIHDETARLTRWMRSVRERFMRFMQQIESLYSPLQPLLELYWDRILKGLPSTISYNKCDSRWSHSLDVAIKQIGPDYQDHEIFKSRKCCWNGCPKNVTATLVVQPGFALIDQVGLWRWSQWPVYDTMGWISARGNAIPAVKEAQRLWPLWPMTKMPSHGRLKIIKAKESE